MAETSVVTRREVLAGLAAGAVAAAAPGVVRGAEAGGDGRPNVLVVLTDDHSYPHVSCYDNPDIKTPNLGRFAAAGLRFDRAYVACPQCVPSRASIMCGRSPVGLQMTRFSAPLQAEAVVYPQLLKAAGYYTGVAGRTYHLDGSKLPPELKKVFGERGLVTFPKRLDYVRTGSRQETMQQLTEFLGQVPAGRPFCLQLCSSDPHRPLDQRAIAEPHDPAALKLPGHYPDTPLVRADFARYYDEIARFDSDFGRILQALDERGLAENTIVLFMGDNGASQLRGKGTLYEFGIHVPLLVRWPGKVRAGGTTAALVSGEDLAPTLLQAAGVPVPPEMTGRSFLPLLLGQEHQPRERLFAERGAHGSGLPTNSALFDLGRCVVTLTHKLIYNALWQLPYHPVDFAGDPLWKDLQARHEAGSLPPKLDEVLFRAQRPMFELFDLTADPLELDNLAGRREHAALERELKFQLSQWMLAERDYLPLPLVG